MSVKGVALLAVLNVFVSAIPVSAEVISGVGVLSQGAWDFSESASVHPKLDPNADLTFVLIVDPPPERTAVWGLNGATLVMVDSSFAELTTAPEDTSLYDWEWPLLMAATYVIRTTERHYAKFRILDLMIPMIEYVYQPDGSRILTNGVPTGIAEHITTWGRLKALYQ